MGDLHSYLSYVGVSSLGASALLYILGLESYYKSKALSKLACFEKLEDLNDLRDKLPQKVAIRGRVNSNSPRKCVLNDNIVVMHEVVEEEIWRKERQNGRVVNQPFELSRTMEMSEWFLEDGQSTMRIKVEDGKHLEGLRSVLQISQVFTPEKHDYKTGLSNLIWDKAIQMSKQGVRKTECFLPVGTIVTVIGELDSSILAREPSLARLAANRNQPPSSPTSSTSTSYYSQPQFMMTPSAPPLPEHQTVAHLPKGSSYTYQLEGLKEPLLLRKPTGDGLFVITPKTLQQLQASVSRFSRICKYAALGFAAFGVVMIARKALLRLYGDWREKRSKQRMDEFIEQQRRQMPNRSTALGEQLLESSASSASHTAEQDRDIGTCVVCIDKEVNMVFTACGHLCICEGCAKMLNRCPVCRVRGSAIKVFRP